MKTRIERMPNVSNYIAFMHGPILLGAKTGSEDMNGLVAGDSRWGHIASGKKLPLNEAPIIVEDDMNALAKKILPVAGKPFTFTFAPGTKLINADNLTLEPFYGIHDARYEMYWMTLTNNGYSSYIDSLGVLERKNAELQKRTIDFVAPGEQQPEVDHAMERQSSNTGNNMDEFWREARNGGYFSYKLSTNNETGLSLMVRYWGAETGNRKFDIYVDDQKLVSEDIAGKWNKGEFKNVEYVIPDEMVKNKASVRIKFQTVPENTAGSVYNVRLLRK
jgi:uncharacterized protein